MSGEGQKIAITVAPAGESEFVITVAGKRETEHRVAVTVEQVRRYAPKGVGIATLLHESFSFLLEREPNTSILPRFELSVIERYFPEYREEIRRRLKRSGDGD